MSADHTPAKRTPGATTVSRRAVALASWEDAETHAARLCALMIEHAPQGPTETHLVEQLAQLMLRRDRLASAEQGLLCAGLQTTTEHSWSRRELIDRVRLIPGGEGAEDSHIQEALTSDEAADHEFIADTQACFDSLQTALTQLRSGEDTAYGDALVQLHPDMRDAWEGVLAPADDDEEEPEWTPSAADLKRYIEADLKPWMIQCMESRRAYPLIRAQARAQAFEPVKMTTLYDLDARLTRQLEKTLAMLIRLQDMRRDGAEGSP